MSSTDLFSWRVCKSRSLPASAKPPLPKLQSEVIHGWKTATTREKEKQVCNNFLPNFHLGRWDLDTHTDAYTGESGSGLEPNAEVPALGQHSAASCPAASHR